jgi:hypothetical protein
MRSKYPVKNNRSINESTMIVKVEKPVRRYFENLMRQGFSHHSIAAPGKVGKQLECLARLAKELE